MCESAPCRSEGGSESGGGETSNYVRLINLHFLCLPPSSSSSFVVVVVFFFIFPATSAGPTDDDGD